MKTKKKKTKKKSHSLDWLEIIKEMIIINAKNAVQNAFQEARQRTSDYLQNIIAKISLAIVSSLVILLGVVFLMIGLAAFLNEIIGSTRGLGYLIVGLTVALIGVILNEKGRCCSKKRKK